MFAIVDRSALTVPVNVTTSVAIHVPGNPGPQPQFDARQPQYRAVVPYFTIIE
jgi:hypothetical protein